MVEAESIDGNLAVENSNGAVHADGIRGGAGITTSFAPVTIVGVGGPVDVLNQNGSVDVAAVARKGASRPCSNMTLKTSFAPIRIRIPDNAGFAVTARTSYGKVTSDFPLTSWGSFSAESINGKIGSGECQMTLTDNNGNIEILRSFGKL
jgi:DUF4097 and DUF4098 domain-containing protein YvlB